MSKKPLTPIPAAAMPAGPAPLPDAPNAHAYYLELFLALKPLYWQAFELERKDQIAAAQDEAYEILTALNEADLDKNTEAFRALSSKVAMTNLALKQIQADITKITKNITTGANVIAAITKVLSIAPMFA